MVTAAGVLVTAAAAAAAVLVAAAAAAAAVAVAAAAWVVVAMAPAAASAAQLVQVHSSGHRQWILLLGSGRQSVLLGHQQGPVQGRTRSSSPGNRVLGWTGQQQPAQHRSWWLHGHMLLLLLQMPLLLKATVQPSLQVQWSQAWEGAAWCHWVLGTSSSSSSSRIQMWCSRRSQGGVLSLDRMCQNMLQPL
jgi:hypothetical protein